MAAEHQGMTNKRLLVILATLVPLTAAAESYRGQPAPTPASKAKTATITGFQYGESYVRTKERAELMKLAKEWKASPSWTRITVEGHGYVEGNEEKSITLGELRAERVRKLLIKYGIDAKLVVAVGHSRAEPGRYVELTIEECVTDGCHR
jgi:outer membrane protein OmpA-like peptidoglycan-associated protein